MGDIKQTLFLFLRRKTMYKVTIMISVFLFSAIAFGTLPADRFVYLGNSIWQAEFDTGGYSDCIYRGVSLRHPYGSHEVLSGEYGCAIYYDQIPIDPCAMWLTNYFLYPSFSTNSNFVFDDADSWDDQNNPLEPFYPFQTNYHGTQTVYDTAQSKISNGQIEVTIDCEVVDLGEQDANGVGGSPIAFSDANGTVAYVYSEPNILLQTYTIKNISASTITGIEFYQMLCGLYYNADYSSYTSESFPDPLSNYVPYNPVHKAPDSNYAGNFRYDISQWGYGDPNTEHVDWLCFSSTVPPDAFENGMFYSNGGEPTTGTYTHIKNHSSLNNNDYYEFDGSGSYDRIAGVMKWNLGSLSPNQTVKHTIAVMFGSKPVNYEPPLPEECDGTTLTNTDDVSGCAPRSTEQTDNFINYNICYSITCDLNSVSIVDTLPADVDYDSCTGGGDYNEVSHTVTWDLGNRSANDSNCFTLKVRVSESATACSTLINMARMYTDGQLIRTATDGVQVCGSVHNLTKGGEYTTIQSAINDADPNNIIEADPGTYENITLSSM
jgi:hypothetical protein